MAEIKNKFKVASMLLVGLLSSMFTHADDKAETGKEAGSDDAAKSSAEGSLSAGAIAAAVAAAAAIAADARATCCSSHRKAAPRRRRQRHPAKHTCDANSGDFPNDFCSSDGHVMASEASSSPD